MVTLMRMTWSNVQITNWDGIALDHLASRDIPQLIEQVAFYSPNAFHPKIVKVVISPFFSVTMLR